MTKGADQSAAGPAFVAGCLLLIVGALLVLAALIAAAVNIGALALFGPWALMVVGVGATLLLRPTSMSLLRASSVLTFVNALAGVALAVGSSPGFLLEISVLLVLSLLGLCSSLIALRRLRPATRCARP
jgi:hypothetical protein